MKMITDFDDGAVKIIGKHIEEFGELAYDHGYRLIARRRLFSIFLYL